MHCIQRWALTRFDVALDRVIGDSQVSTTHLWIGVLELEDGDGRVGTGFFHTVTEPLPSLSELRTRFAHELADQVIGASPFAWVNRLERPRRGRTKTSVFFPSVEQAMWDLQGQILGLPLYKLLGGSRERVPAYASGLEFHLTDEQVAAFYAGARAAGFSTFKVKVGHPDLARDIRRLRLVQEVVGGECLLMADANEAWAPKEAIRRLTRSTTQGCRSTGSRTRACVTTSTGCGRSPRRCRRCSSMRASTSICRGSASCSSGGR